jgi:hypothetical protein
LTPDEPTVALDNLLPVARGNRRWAGDGDGLVDGPEPLFSIIDMSIVGPDRTRRSQVPLSRGELFINARNEPARHDEIAAEMASADGTETRLTTVHKRGVRGAWAPLRPALSRRRWAV